MAAVPCNNEVNFLTFQLQKLLSDVCLIMQLESLGTIRLVLKIFSPSCSVSI